MATKKKDADLKGGLCSLEDLVPPDQNIQLRVGRFRRAWRVSNSVGRQGQSYQHIQACCQDGEKQKCGVFNRGEEVSSHTRIFA